MYSSNWTQCERCGCRRPDAQLVFTVESGVAVARCRNLDHCLKLKANRAEVGAHGKAFAKKVSNGV